MILIPSEALHSQYIGYPSFLNCGLSILPAEIGRQLVVARISVDLQPSVPLGHPEHSLHAGLLSFFALRLPRLFYDQSVLRLFP